MTEEIGHELCYQINNREPKVISKYIATLPIKEISK